MVTPTYSELLKEYFDNCFFEERDWLFELDAHTNPVYTMIRNWQGDVLRTERTL